ncbi:RNA-directed DNA polymerase (Reverse transcriptase), partial [Trifolium medium]|nr:RNA-directed DNA polymerase (Reverse transcriptase) [Trifolium medium]
AVSQWGTPESVSEIRSFLGLDGYYRRFIEGFSKLALPLTKLTRKEQAFVWDGICEKSFQELKRRLNTAPVLILPDAKESSSCIAMLRSWDLAECLCKEV